ncbi:uncharacterized protein TRIVIDRAFT_134921, partial [Trichoderma virens Gv29-8]
IWPGANKDDCQRTAIEGLGGVGKTQLALEAVYLLHNQHPDCSIFWVPAIDVATFENAYRDIGRLLQVKGAGEDKADIKRLVNTTLSEESSGSWLLVIDNADDIELLFGETGPLSYLPFSRNGSILFTTRNHNAATKLDISTESIIRVEEMDEAEALGLLQKGLKETQMSNIEATKRLLKFLANLPLAIRQASAYIATTDISTSEYLELCESDNGDMIELLSRNFEDRHRYKEIQNPVAKTWHISFRQISQYNTLAAKFLKFMSILVEKDIPKSLLPTARNIEAIEAIGTLKAYAFIIQRDEENSFDIHRLVRLAMRNWLEKNGELKECVTSAIQQLNQVLPFPKHENRDVWIKYLPHAHAALELPEYLAINEREARLSFKVAEGNYILGRYQTAEDIYRQTLKVYEKMLGKEHPLTLDSMDNLGGVLSNLGKYKESEEMHRQTLEIRKKMLGKEHPSTLNSMGNLGVVLRKLGKYKKSEEMHRQTLEVHKKV